MGEELLQAKGDYKELGKKLGFQISQSPSYVTSQIQPYSGSRSISSSESRYNMDWFNLYKVEYGILDEDTYNMDENGYIMGVAGSSKVVFSKYQKQAFINQAGNWSGCHL